MNIERWIILLLLVFIFGPFHNVIPVNLYCTEGNIFGCDWDKGMISKDLLYITIPK